VRLLQGAAPSTDTNRVRLLTLTRRARTVAALAVTGSLLAAAPWVSQPARADTSTQAAANAKALLAKVHAVQARVLVAEKKYNKAFTAVSASVTTAIHADSASQATSQAADAAQADAITQVEALYESGGSLAAYASMLTTGDLNGLSDRTEMVSRVVSMQATAVRQATTRATTANAIADRASRREHVQIGTERTVAAAAGKVESLLAQEKTLLAAADKHLASVQAAEKALAAAQSSFGSITQTQIDGLHILPPSAQYLALYHGASTICPGLSWTVLAAIGQVESGHGRNMGTSSAGAQGPMQFEPATFAAYAIDGDHDGVKSIMDPADSIFTASHYLCANGAGRGPSALSAAILHYNHAGWYVEMVLKLAGEYAGASS
jgi:membrane-bound lytic murein transglycosylase B